MNTHRSPEPATVNKGQISDPQSLWAFLMLGAILAGSSLILRNVCVCVGGGLVLPLWEERLEELPPVTRKPASLGVGRH